MTLMRIREVAACARHPRTTIVLEDVGQHRTLTFHADRDEARRLTQEIARRGCACHPIYDFLHSLLLALDADVTRVVLDDAKGEGIAGLVYVSAPGGEMGVPCYPPDALALALRANVPIYATAAALAQGEPLPPAGGAHEASDVARWLEEVKPQDFWPRLDRDERDGAQP
jgi:bifunctional DNase/RNase